MKGFLGSRANQIWNVIGSGKTMRGRDRFLTSDALCSGMEEQKQVSGEGRFSFGNVEC